MVATIHVDFLKQVCQGFNAISHNRSVWADALVTYAFKANLPVPGLRGRELSSLDASDLENLVHNTRHLRRAWSSLEPKPSRTLDLLPSPDQSEHSKVTGIHFLPGRGNRWLLHIGFYVDPTAPLICSTLTCWDLHVNPPLRRTTIDYEPERMSWSLLLVNSDPTHPAAFVVSRGAFVR